MSDLLPLFPLDLVLLPGAVLPLHIFEPRYREMVAECLSLKRVFGVVRVVEDGIAKVGCTAQIVDVIKRYEDGRFDIVTIGAKRFELVHVTHERLYLQADVEYLEDAPDQPTQKDRDQAIALHSEILSLAGEAEASRDLGSGLLSFALASSLPLDLDVKQTLLSLESEAERIRALMDYCNEILPKLRRVVRARKSASGNGHAH